MKKDNRVVIVSLIILSLISIFYIIYIWSSIIIPFVIAFLISFAIISLSKFFNSKWINNYFSFLLSILSFLFIFYIIWVLINSNVKEIASHSYEYQTKLQDIIKSFDNTLNEKNIKIADFISYKDIIKKIDIPSLATGFASYVTAIFKNTWIVLFFVVFILLESRFFIKKLDLMFSKERSKNKILEVLRLIEKDVKAYFFIKTIVSLITGFLSYLVMILFWLDFALFWAFLIFLLNYIPNIWSIVAVFFSVIFSLIQFWSFTITLAMLASLVWVQVIMWNLVEPRFMWNKLNLSPLVILLSLLFWWNLWGIAWMLLCVPIMVIINIILSHIKETRSIAILLSEKGIIKTDFGNVWNKKRNIFEKIKQKVIKK